MTLMPAVSAWARQGDAGSFWFVVMLLGLLVVAAAWWALVHLRRHRAIEHMPTALIRSAPQGYVELRGMAELMDGDPIHAPLSLRKCVWYQYKVEHLEQTDSNGRRRARWVTVDQGLSEHLFYLIDTSGRCAIDPDGAAVTPMHHHVWYGNSRIPGRYHDDDGAWWARALGRLGAAYRYTERRIDPGDQLYAIGQFITHGGGGASAIDADAMVGDRLREWKRDRAWVLREFDDNRDGQIDLAEWSVARARAEVEVAAELENTSGPPPVDVLGHTRDRRRPFILAAGSEDTLVTRSKRTAAALLVAAMPLLCVTLWLISTRLGAT